MYIPRFLTNLYMQLLKQFPAILITGPRQSGKTTFLKHVYADKADYITFDDPLSRSYAKEDPNDFLQNLSDKPVILDEIQYVPELFSYIKINIDNNRRNCGKWIMTGSQQFNIMKNISDSLAGRVAILELLPFNYSEILEYESYDLDEAIWYGGYPENILYSKGRDIWISSYIQTYIERDVRNLLQVRDLNTFQTFLGLCSSNHSQELNIASLSRQTGVSQPTCKQWISILEASYIILLIKPYHKNFNKRLIKSPKLYFIDQAIAAFLTRQPDKKSLVAGSMGGAFFESFIITETYKTLVSLYTVFDLYYWRSHDGLEVDLLLEKDGKTWPIEIKKTATPNLKHSESIKKFTSLAKANNSSIQTPIIVCNSQKKSKMPGKIDVLPWKEYFKWLLTI